MDGSGFNTSANRCDFLLCVWLDRLHAWMCAEQKLESFVESLLVNAKYWCCHFNHNRWWLWWYIWLENFLKYIFLIHQNQYLYKKGPNIGGDTIVVVIWLIGISPIDTCLTSRYCFFCSLSSSCTDRKLIKNCGLVFCWSICHHIHNVNYHEKGIFLPSIYYRTCVYFA